MNSVTFYVFCYSLSLIFHEFTYQTFPEVLYEKCMEQVDYVTERSESKVF